MNLFMLQIGGIGPELDEDFSTSYMMVAHGYRGAFSIETSAGTLSQVASVALGKPNCRCLVYAQFPTTCLAFYPSLN